MKNDRFTDFDDEVKQLVLDFERTVMRGETQFYDIDELEMIIDYYLEVDDKEPLIWPSTSPSGSIPTASRLR